MSSLSGITSTGIATSLRAALTTLEKWLISLFNLSLLSLSLINIACKFFFIIEITVNAPKLKRLIWADAYAHVSKIKRTKLAPRSKIREIGWNDESTHLD